jgi:hypothetical protein
MADRFAVPDQMFGHVPDDFYGLIGRIALVATLLEDRVLGLLWALDEEPQATHAGLAAKRLAPMIRQRCKRHADALGGALAADIESALALVLDVLEERHALVHSLWPQPTMQKAQGWRSKRVSKAEGGGSKIVWTETSEDKLQRCLAELVRMTHVVLVLTDKVWSARGRM